LVAMEKSEGGHLGGATCFFIEVCWGSILFCFFLLPSLLFLKNNKGYCHFNFMSNLFLIHLIIIYFFMYIFKCFFFNFILFFFQFNLLIFSWLGIEIHNFFFVWGYLSYMIWSISLASCSCFFHLLFLKLNFFF
jgi:hypothetical protein